MRIEGVIFDLDGTLVDTVEDLGDSANAMLQSHGFKTHSVSDYLKWIGNGAVKFIGHAIGRDIADDQLLAYVSEFKEIYERNLSNKSRLYEGIDSLLDELTSLGIKLAILSNKPHLLTKKVASYYLSAWDFDPVFGQRDHVPRKPDPAAATEIAGLLEIKAEHILFVGDSQGDLKTAEAAGMVPVGVTWGYGKLESRNGNGHILLSHPQELLKLLS